jgi:hypothetical protein
MKKLFIVFVMLLAGSAWAEWVMYGEHDTATFYYDPATIRKDGNMRRVWDLTNLSNRNKNGVMSYRSQNEYDCKQERLRNLALSTHSKLMAGGEVLVTGGGENNWTAIPPGTILEKLLKIVCAN